MGCNIILTQKNTGDPLLEISTSLTEGDLQSPDALLKISKYIVEEFNRSGGSNSSILKELQTVVKGLNKTNQFVIGKKLANLIPNSSVKELQDRYQYMKFTIPPETPIVLVSNLSQSEGIDGYITRTTANGHTVYIVKNLIKAIKQFAKYTLHLEALEILRREGIQGSEALLVILDEIKQDLTQTDNIIDKEVRKIKEEKRIELNEKINNSETSETSKKRLQTTLEQLQLSDWTNNAIDDLNQQKSRISINSRLSDGVNLYRIISEFINGNSLCDIVLSELTKSDIRQWLLLSESDMENRGWLSDNTFVELRLYLSKFSFRRPTSISISALRDIMTKTSKEVINNEIFELKLREFLKEDGSLKLKNNSIYFNYGTVLLEKKYPSLTSIGYSVGEIMELLSSLKYKGFYKYELKTGDVLITPNMPSKNLSGVIKNKEEADSYIDSLCDSSDILGKLATTHIYDLNETDLYFTSKLFYSTGTIIPALDISRGEYARSVTGKEMQFYIFFPNLLNKIEGNEAFKTKLQETLDTPEKIFIFLSHFKNICILTFPITDELINNMSQFLETIENAKTIYYCVDDSYGIAKKLYTTHVVRLNESANLLASEIDDSTSPMYNTLALLLLKFSDKGIKLELINQEEISNILGEGLDYSKVRAFTKDGIIYMNINNCSRADAFHEYVHMIFKLLLDSNEEAYKSILASYFNIVKDTDLFKKRFNSLLKNPIYANLFTENPEEATADVIEELFIRDFVKYLLGTSSNLESLFSEAQLLTENTLSIFDGIDFQKLAESENNNAQDVFKLLLELIKVQNKESKKLGYYFPITEAISTYSVELINLLDNDSDKPLYKICK